MSASTTPACTVMVAPLRPDLQCGSSVPATARFRAPAEWLPSTRPVRPPCGTTGWPASLHRRNTRDLIGAARPDDGAGLHVSARELQPVLRPRTSSPVRTPPGPTIAATALERNRDPYKKSIRNSNQIEHRRARRGVRNMGSDTQCPSEPARAPRKSRSRQSRAACFSGV